MFEDPNEIPPLNPAVQEAINNQIKDATTMATSDAQAYGQHVKDMQSQNPFGGPSLMGNAINNKFARQYKQDVENMSAQRELGKSGEDFQRLSQTFQTQGKRYQLARERDIMIKKRIMDARAQRAQTLGALLQIGGTIVGGLLGGPAGAMAGNAAGQVAGSQA